MTAMHDPPHPGEVLQEEFLKPLGLSASRAAGMLGISRKTLSRLINGETAITPDLARRLELHFNPSAGSWLRHQEAWERWRDRADDAADR